MREDLLMTMGDGAYRGARDDNAQARIMENLKRDWDRQPELRAQYGHDFQRYLVSMKNNVTFRV